jgi:hypothetical protein
MGAGGGGVVRAAWEKETYFMTKETYTHKEDF